MSVYDVRIPESINLVGELKLIFFVTMVRFFYQKVELQKLGSFENIQDSLIYHVDPTNMENCQFLS